MRIFLVRGLALTLLVTPNVVRAELASVRSRPNPHKHVFGGRLDADPIRGK